jgi:IS5 family transposase
LLQQTGIISNEAALIDSSVLDSNIIYPNDVALIFNAFEKMVVFCHEYNVPLWWDQDNIKQLWHTFWLQKKKNRQQWLTGFFLLFIPVLEVFKIQVDALQVSKNPKKSKASLKRKERAEQLSNLFQLLIQQTAEKLEGKKSIDNRIVSLDEVDARPIKKGKHHPSCEFGSTVEMSFNRDGFMVTIENFIGKPDDTTLYLNTLELYAKKMNKYPSVVVTDQGYRSADNFNNTPKTVNHTFLGKSIDVEEELQDFCRKARAATEGFISVVKRHRGLGRSLYRGFNGDRIWSLFCQVAHNLKKFVQLWRKEKINDDSLVKLGLLG